MQQNGKNYFQKNENLCKNLQRFFLLHPLTDFLQCAIIVLHYWCNTWSWEGITHIMKNVKKKLIQGLCIVLAIVLVLLSLSWINAYRAHHVDPIAQSVLDQIDLEQAKKLMIVAHPDDETLWGGGHLSEGDYLVVCITHGSDKTRSAEFYSVMEASGNQGIMLSYPDKVNGKRDDWEAVQDGISADLEKVIELKTWDLIVTHNEAGEYGHIHHKKTNQIVTQYYQQADCTIPLYTFGTYHRKAALPDYAQDMTRIPDDQLQKKEELLSLYHSQERTIENLSHMNPYEEWTLVS